MSASIRRYLATQSASRPSFSADGKWIAFLSNISGMNQVWRVPAGSTTPAWPEQLTFENDRILYAAYSPVDPDVLLFSKDVGGNENAQLFLLNTRTATITALTAGHEDAMHVPNGFARGGNAIFSGSNEQNKARFDLMRHDAKGAESELIWQNDGAGYLFGLTASNDGGRVAFTRNKSSADVDLLEVDLETGTARLLWESDAPARFGKPLYLPDDSGLLVISDIDSPFMHIRRFDIATQEWETLSHSEWGVSGMELDGTGRYLAYLLNVAGVGELHLLDLQTGNSQQLPPVDNAPGIVAWMDGTIAWSPDSRLIAFSYSSAVTTSDIYVWDLDNNEVYPVTKSTHGGLPKDEFGIPELIEYESFDGRQIPAWYYPTRTGSAEQPAPVVVMVHGGPEGQSRPSFNFLAQYFIAQGYGVLLPNVRGSIGYGKAYAALDNVEKRMDSVADLAHGAYWLQQRPEVDSNKIVVYGGSYGGFMVLAGLTTYPDIWAAGVNIVGISNFVTFLENTSAYRRAHREAEYGSLANDREFMESIAPINHLDNITVPLMVIHGANDPRVPLSEAEQLVAALEERNHPVKFLVFDDEGHGLAKLHNKVVAYPAIVDFIASLDGIKN